MKQVYELLEDLSGHWRPEDSKDSLLKMRFDMLGSNP